MTTNYQSYRSESLKLLPLGKQLLLLISALREPCNISSNLLNVCDYIYLLGEEIELNGAARQRVAAGQLIISNSDTQQDSSVRGVFD